MFVYVDAFLPAETGENSVCTGFQLARAPEGRC